MANTITTKTLHNGARNFVSHVIIESNSTATDETDTTLFDASALGLPEDGSMKFDFLEGQLSGFSAELIWDGNTNETFVVIPDYDVDIRYGAKMSPVPNGAGTPTGDVLISTSDISSNDRGSFTVGFKKS